MSISEEYQQKFTLSDNANPFVNPNYYQDKPITYDAVYEPIKCPENPIYTEIPQPPVVTYNKMKWRSKTALNNPHRALNVASQQLSFTKTLTLPRRVGILTNNVPKTALTVDCYTPVNNQVVVINNSTTDPD